MRHIVYISASAPQLLRSRLGVASLDVYLYIAAGSGGLQSVPVLVTESSLIAGFWRGLYEVSPLPWLPGCHARLSG